MSTQIGEVIWINGPVVRVRGSQHIGMLEVVEVGDEHLVGEIIGLERDIITVQVYEETAGLRPGAPVFSTGYPLSVELGPGLLQSIFDGIQRPLPVLELRSGAFIGRGIKTTPLYRKQKWAFTPRAQVGDRVSGGMILGVVPETPLIEHRVLTPPDVEGTLTWIAPAGEYTIVDPIARLQTSRGEQEITMLQRWPVRRPRPYRQRLLPTEMLVTGQRVLDTFFPLVKGGTAAIPGGFGAGKCVTGDTLVLLDDGTLRPIAELFEEYSNQGRQVAQGIESYTYLDKPLGVFTLENNRVVPQSATVVYKGKADEVIRITTRSGRAVKVTPIHKLHVVTPELEIKEVEAQQLKVGDYLAAPRRIWVKGQTQTLNALELKGERQGAITHIPATVDGDFAEFLGLLLGDGHLSPRTVMFFNTDESLLSRFAELGQRLFSLEPKRSINRTISTVRFHSTILTKLMLSLGVPGSGHRKSRTWAVPEVILKSSDDTIARFLAAYFSCDGSISSNKKELALSTASQTMAAGLSYLLMRLGILHSLSSKTVKGWEYFRLTVQGKEEIGRFYTACRPQNGVPHTRKWDQIASHLDDEEGKYTAVDIVPAGPEVLQTAYQSIGSPRDELALHGVHISDYLCGREKMSAATFRQFAALSDSPQIKNFADALDSIFCDPIVKIETIPGPHDVYDFTVPGTHNFVGGRGALILHNTITQHQIAKWSDADVVVYVGCGERGNEMTEVLQEFPELKDPRSGRSLMERTILIANTSNMPVAAREASIYTGITLAEYYRDMGYHVAIMADSTSRWAEALREISGRLEEMPAEEGYPAYLAARLAEFYERAGYTITLNGAPGSVSIIGAVSPPGGDFSEPVTQHTKRFIRCFWALDKTLASARHFPAINWLDSYSEYVDEIADWWRGRGYADWHTLRTQAMEILQRESHLQQIVKLVGPDALPDDQRLILETAWLLREGILQQSALDAIDAYATIEKQIRMLRAILHFHDRAARIVAKGCPIILLHNLPIVNTLVRMKTTIPNDAVKQIEKLIAEMDMQMDQLEHEYA
ncbi:MAG TPA: V-type ATP synthase subunit A [Anaerolineae bacterium]|nr:V-type ATP synthase subunit A [Anaerolineae bacterium]HQK15241.1 V-type ATP synthase subunit A [Anaerolineae bacterium]